MCKEFFSTSKEFWLQTCFRLSLKLFLNFISGISKINKNVVGNCSGIGGSSHGTHARSFAAALRNLAKNAGPNEESENVTENEITYKKVKF